MQPEHNEEEEHELGLPDFDFNHMFILPELYDVDIPFTISPTQQGMTTIHSTDNPGTPYTQKLSIFGFCLSINLQHQYSLFNTALFTFSRGISSWGV